jgi:hypothetical protein
MRALTPAEAVAIIGESLGMSAVREPSALMKPALRRALFALAPASRADIVRYVAEPLSSLGINRDTVEAALDDLVVYGDALEMRKGPEDPWDAPDVVLRPAPPSFVEREDGTLIILGVAGDQPTALPPDLNRRVTTQGPARILHASKAEHLADHLHILGFAQLSEQAWLREPAIQTASAHRRYWTKMLAKLASSEGAVNDLEILDWGRSTHYYRGRWRTPTAATNGMFVARRPQLYGARLWSFAAIENGVCRQVLDFYEDQDRQRPCDIAWRLQAAIDADLGHPQPVRVRQIDDACLLDFFGPLPAFAERRLLLAGTKQAGANCLFTFAIAPSHTATELAALERSLWMRPVRDKETL